MQLIQIPRDEFNPRVVREFLVRFSTGSSWVITPQFQLAYEEFAVLRKITRAGDEDFEEEMRKSASHISTIGGLPFRVVYWHGVQAALYPEDWTNGPIAVLEIDDGSPRYARAEVPQHD